MNMLIRLGSGRAFKLLAVGAMRFKGAAIAIFVVAALVFLSNWKLFLGIGIVGAVIVVGYSIARDYLRDRKIVQEVEENWDNDYPTYEIAHKTSDRWTDLARVVGLASKPLEKKLGYLEAVEAADRSMQARLRKLRQEPDVLTPELLELRVDELGYRLDVKMLDGQTVDDYIKAAEPLAEATVALDVRPQKIARGIVSLLFVLRDPLAEPVAGFEWPAVFDIKNTPIALDEYGKSVNWPFTHTLIVGATGSGKGSVFWSLIRTLLPGKAAGLVQFYGIDPKLDLYVEGMVPGLFEGMTMTAEDHAELLEDLVEVMNDRQGGGRRFVVSEDRPYIVLFMDEIISLKATADRKTAQRIDDSMMYLLTRGRSLGIYVIGAVQSALKEDVGRMREFFPMKIALRLEKKDMVDRALGDGSVEEGARNHEIAPATEANDYETAGLGWMRTDDGMTRLRFPYTNDDYIEHAVTEFEREDSDVLEGEVIEGDEDDD